MAKQKKSDADREAAEKTSLRRRRGLRLVLARYNLTPTDLARRAGLSAPNRFYNFLSGSSDGLSTDTIEAILMAFPELTFEELVGWSSGRPRMPPQVFAERGTTD